MPSSQRSSSALISEFATDPEMRELVEQFVQALPERIEALRCAFEQTRLRDLQRLSHQLKGAAGGYGFPTVGEAAARLEAILRQPASAQLEDIAQELDALIGLCSRAARGGR